MRVRFTRSSETLNDHSIAGLYLYYVVFCLSNPYLDRGMDDAQLVYQGTIPLHGRVKWRVAEKPDKKTYTTEIQIYLNCGKIEIPVYFISSQQWMG